MASLALKNIEKKFGTFRALYDIDLDIPDGTFVSLVGPSGCGKSTLLRMIAGLEAVSAGTISIGDKVVNNVPAKQRDIAMVFQNYALYPHMRVYENITFSLQLQRIPKPEIERRLQDAAKMLGLEAYLDRYPRELSGGQRQRVAMGRAIVRDPKAFLFDEPLSNLDAKLRVIMRGEIKSLHQRLKSTMIYVTHDQIEAMTMSDLIVVLNGGFIAQVGKPLQLYDTPANTFVASFIGSPSMNFFKGKISDTSTSLFETRTGQCLPMEGIDRRFLGRPVIYGIRPEHIELDETSSNCATITLVEPTGAETYVRMSFGGEEFAGLFKERIGKKPGDKIGVSFMPKHVHLFDIGTEARIDLSAMSSP